LAHFSMLQIATSGICINLILTLQKKIVSSSETIEDYHCIDQKVLACSRVAKT